MPALNTILRGVKYQGDLSGSLSNPSEGCVSLLPLWSLHELLRMSWELRFLMRFKIKLLSKNILVYDLEGQREGEALFYKDHYKQA